MSRGGPPERAPLSDARDALQMIRRGWQDDRVANVGRRQKKKTPSRRPLSLAKKALRHRVFFFVLLSAVAHLPSRFQFDRYSVGTDKMRVNRRDELFAYYLCEFTAIILDLNNSIRYNPSYLMTTVIGAIASNAVFESIHNR